MEKAFPKRMTALILVLLLCMPLCSGFSVKVHAATQSQKNIAARADWYYGITWVAQETVAGWDGTFYKGNTYHIPYGQPVYSGKYIGYGVGFEEFLNAAATAGSIFYTGRSYYTDASAPYYTSDCSAFVSWCWNISRTTTHAINSVSTGYGNVTTARATSTLQLGDALNYAGVHVVLVSDLKYDASGAITSIEITEQTTPQMKRTTYTPATLAQKYGSYSIQRYTGSVPGAPANLPCHGSGTVEEESWIEQACFDAVVYRHRYKDLAEMTDAQLKEHWLSYGIQEGRVASVILDLQYYRDNNSDIKNAFGDDYTAIYNHFITSGYQENRKSSPVFDGDYYLKNQPDVAKTVGKDYLKHYVQSGMKEGRRASLAYSPDYYLRIRPDVAQTWPGDYVMAAKHYTIYGVPEKIVAYDNQKPEISEAKITNVTAAGYTVCCKVTDNVGVTKVAFPTWTLLGNQDDLVSDWATTQLGTKSGSTYTFQVKASDHNNEGGHYVTHIYAYDAQGNRTSCNLEVVEVKDPVPEPTEPQPTEPEVTEPEPTEPEPTEPQPTEPEPTEPEAVDEITLIPASSYELEGKVLKDVKPSTPVRSLLRQFANETLKVLDREGNELTSYKQVGTGATVNLYVDGQLVDTVTVVVRGDVDGNSKVDTTDYMRVKAAFLGTRPISDVEQLAADVDENGTVDTTDYMRIKADFIGLFELNP